MNDKDIRRILIAYLQAAEQKIRIYQEKSIHSAVCDVMAVTDCLTGYEIKGDGDNYSRLDSQIVAYNRFFDRNYLVVSSGHLRSAEKKIPDDWGIVCILDDSVRIERKAKPNKAVSRNIQLSILWKIELKNILVKNGLPLFAQKNKSYIERMISEKVDSSLLGKQIAQELMERDYSFYGAVDYTITSEQNEKTSHLELIDTLSEKDMSEFSLDQWISLYRQAKRIQQKKDELFTEKAEKEKAERIPHEIPYTDIEVSLGVPWIAKHIVDEFITHLIGREPRCKDYGYQWTEYEPVTGAWRVNDKRTSEIMSSVEATVKYGTGRYNALQIIEATLNLREIRIYDPYNKYSEADTLAVLEKQRIIKEEFGRWIWEDEDRRWEVEESYNKMFAGFKKEHYDGRDLKFPDMNPDIKLYPYQLDAVQRIISSQNTLLAFDVGSGKTYIMIAAAMKMRRDGLSQKNVFVVPNHIVGQWEKIFTVMYPDAKVLAVDPKSFKPHMREKVLRQIKNGDYDGIIIAYSCFEMIPLSVKYITHNMEQQLLMLSQATASLKNNVDYIWRASQLEKEKNKIRKLTNDFLNSMDYDGGGITFDALEINSIFVDEAHNYKNIRIDTNLKRLRGINTEGSAKCMDMMQKIRCVQQNNNGRGGILATGTPYASPYQH